MAEDKGTQGKGGREMRAPEEEEPISQRFNSNSELKVKLGCYDRATKEIKFSRGFMIEARGNSGRLWREADQSPMQPPI